MKSTVRPTPEAKQDSRHGNRQQAGKAAGQPAASSRGKQAVIMQAAMKDTTGAPGARGYQDTSKGKHQGKGMHARAAEMAAERDQEAEQGTGRRK